MNNRLNKIEQLNIKTTFKECFNYVLILSNIDASIDINGIKANLEKIKEIFSYKKIDINIDQLIELYDKYISNDLDELNIKYLNLILKDLEISFENK